MRKTLFVTIIAGLFALISVIFLALAFVFSSDEIISSEKKNVAETTLISHQTKKGDSIEISFAANPNRIGEDLYLFNIVLNSDAGKNYKVKNLRLEFDIDDSDILSAFYSAESSDYIIPDVDYTESKKTILFFSDKGYIHSKLLLSGKNVENASFTLKYDIMGNNLYMFNKFYGYEEKIEGLYV